MFLILGWILVILMTGHWRKAEALHGLDPEVDIYFRAHLKHGRTMGKGSNLRFDIVDLEKGDCYNPTSGIFTAPVSGLYQFMFHAQSRTAGVSTYSLINEGKNEIYCSIHSAWDGDSFATIIHVKKGHHVSVRKTGDNGNAQMEGSTQFAGYLLRRE